MAKKKSLLTKKVEIQNELTAQNSLDYALRLTDYDLWTQQASLSTANAFNNMKLDLISLQQILLTSLYKTYGILGKVVDVPVDDAYRNGGFDIVAETIDDEELYDLERKLKENRDIEVLKQARKYARLFGGAALVCLDGGELSQPLDLGKLANREVEFVAVDRWQLTYSLPNVNMPNGKWTLTNYEKINQALSDNIHSSRVHILHGKKAPYLIDQQVQGWGISVYEQIIQDMSQFFKSRNVLFELLDEAKIDVLYLEALQTALSSANGERALQRMVDLIARNKNYKSQITLSTNDKYDQKSTSLTGIEGILKEIRIMMSSAANMPVNKLWGEGVTGFGSGEDSLENYNASIESEIRSQDLDAILWILKIRCWQLFNREIDDIDIDWKSLRVMSSLEEADIHTKRIDNLLKLFDRQLLSPKEFMEIMKKEKMLCYDTKAIRGELEDLPNAEDNNANDKKQTK